MKFLGRIKQIFCKHEIGVLDKSHSFSDMNGYTFVNAYDIKCLKCDKIIGYFVETPDELIKRLFSDNSTKIVPSKRKGDQ